MMRDESTPRPRPPFLTLNHIATPAETLASVGAALDAANAILNGYVATLPPAASNATRAAMDLIEAANLALDCCQSNEKSCIAPKTGA
jgi:predicted outer membrane protein